MKCRRCEGVGHLDGGSFGRLACPNCAGTGSSLFRREGDPTPRATTFPEGVRSDALVILEHATAIFCASLNAGGDSHAAGCVAIAAKMLRLSLEASADIHNPARPASEKQEDVK